MKDNGKIDAARDSYNEAGRKARRLVDVNTIRYKLKQHGCTHYWTELKRILSTQKAITTEAVNALGEIMEMRLCSDPTDKAAEIYRYLNYKSQPFKRYSIKPPEPPN